MHNDDGKLEKEWSFSRVLTKIDDFIDGENKENERKGNKVNRRSLEQVVTKTNVLDTTTKLPPEFSQASRIAISAAIQRNGVDIRSQLIAVHKTQQQIYADMKARELAKH